VIAETRDLPVRFIRIVSPTIRAATSSRSAESQLRRVGARLRPRRFAESEKHARQAAQPESRARAERSGRRAVLPGDLLVLDDENPEASVFGSKEAPANVKLTDYLNA